MLRILAIVLALVGMLIGAIAWSGGGTGRRADFAFVYRGDIYTLDLNQISYMQDIRLVMAIREGLYDLDPATFKPIPAGATGHDLSADQRTWTFHLRRECRWSNGDPITARDYVFSWRRMLEEPGEYTYLFKYIAGAQKYRDALQDYYADATGGAPKPSFDSVGINAPDDYTLVVRLEQPVPYFLDIVAFPPFFPRHARSMAPFKHMQDAAKDQYTYRAEYTRPPNVITNGPFNLVRWDFKRRLILRKNPHYWDRQHVQSDSIEMVITDNPLSQFLIYEAGQVDWLCEFDTELAPEVQSQGRTDVQNSPAFGTSFLTLICTPELPESVARQAGVSKNPLADVRVRRALSMSIDKEFIVQSITRMGELPARTYVPPDGTLRGYTWGAGPYDRDDRRYTHEELQKRYASRQGMTGEGPGLPYNIPEARRLLAEAGYPGGKGFPTLPIIYGTNSVVRQKVCQVLKNQWRANLGIDIDIQGMEGKSCSDKVKKRDYAISPVAWYGDYPDASTFADKYRSDSDQNDSVWQRRDYDELCDRAALETDYPRRMRLLSEAERMVLAEAPIIPLFYYVNVNLARPNVLGVEPNPRNLTMFKTVKVVRR